MFLFYHDPKLLQTDYLLPKVPLAPEVTVLLEVPAIRVLVVLVGVGFETGIGVFNQHIVRGSPFSA